MYVNPPKKPKLAVIYVREGPQIRQSLSAEVQEEMCRDYCAFRNIPVSHSVRVRCDSEESIEVLKYLLRTLPKQVDTLIATDFFCYSFLIPELGSLCYVFQCRPTWLFSLDVIGPVQNSFPTITAQDITEADQRYIELMQIGV